MKRALALLLGTAFVLAFSDLPESSPFFPAVQAVVQRGWMQGYPDGTFKGEVVLNRYQLATALGRVLADLGVAPAPVSFPDIPPGHWALEPLGRAVALGLVSGYPDGTFRGQQELTRAQLAVVLGKLLDRLDAPKGRPLAFTDLPGTHWAAGAAARAVSLGLMSPYPDGTFRPDAPVNRFQLAQALAGLGPWVKGQAVPSQTPSGEVPAPKAGGASVSPAQAVPEAPGKGQGAPSGEAPATKVEGAPVSPAQPAPELPVEKLSWSGKWVGNKGGEVYLLGDKLYRVKGSELQEVAQVPEGVLAALPPFALVAGGVLDLPKGRKYGPIGASDAPALPAPFGRMEEGHLALDPSGNYLLVVPARPLCDCSSRVVRLALLNTFPVGLYAEHIYLLDAPEARVAGVAWPESRKLYVLEAVAGEGRLYLVDLRGAEDLAFGVWDEPGSDLEAKGGAGVKPVAKTLVAVLPEPGRGLAVQGNELFTAGGEALLRFRLP